MNSVPYEWYPSAKKLQVKHYKANMISSMKINEINGVILHTTHSPTTTLEGIQRDWEAKNKKAGIQADAHFVIDREGALGQYRRLSEFAASMNKLGQYYYSVELIADWNYGDGRKPDPAMLGITMPQMTTVSSLISDLSDAFGFPIKAIGRTAPNPKNLADMGKGVGYHAQVDSTLCGKNSYWRGDARSQITTIEFQTIVSWAAFYQKFGY
jgi:hypothetical protein